MKTAKVFKSGNSQAIRIPKEFRFDTDEVYVEKVGGAVILRPVQRSWEPLLRSIDMFPDEFDFKREPMDLSEKDLFS